jgi:hypothetical protein
MGAGYCEGAGDGLTVFGVFNAKARRKQGKTQSKKITIYSLLFVFPFILQLCVIFFSCVLQDTVGSAINKGW